jgi:DNA repair exonuclease SbcCD ATPase subunit
MSVESQSSLFEKLADELPGNQKAEFFRNLHEAGISANDVELAKLLRALQLYKSYYETIPEAIQKASGEVEKLKQDIERLSSNTHDSAEASANLAGQMIQEAEKVRQELTQIHSHVEEAISRSAESMASRMAELLSAGIEQTVLLPLQRRLTDLTESNQAFDDAIARSKQATSILHQNAVLARRVHLKAYALSALIAVCSIAAVSWVSLYRWYADRIEQERVVLIEQVGKNQAVLLQLSRSHRAIEVMQDPGKRHHKLLVMKDASGWQSASKCGVIEFTE